MGSIEDKAKHRRRMQNKRKDFRLRSPIAKDLLTEKYRPRVVKDKRGKEHDLETMTHKDLVDEINKDNE